MSRPTYSTPRNRVRQREIADRFEIAWPWLVFDIRPDEHDPIDVDMRRRGSRTLVGFMEIKEREQTMEQLHAWGGLLLSERKYLTLMAEAGLLGIAAMLGIATIDGKVWWHRVDGGFDNRDWDGRRDRGDPFDMEWCVYLQMPRWRPLIPITNRGAAT